MANKKCPKCGEDNPAEAVMCWACYTPLTAGAGASMGAGMSGAATMPRSGPMGVPSVGVDDEGKVKKEVDPKIYLLGGLFVVGVIAWLFTSGALSGAPAQPATPLIDIQQGSSSGAFSGGSASVPIVPPPPPPAPPSSNGPSQSPPQVQAYTSIVSPSPKYTTATFAIVPTQPVGATEAVKLARAARRDMAGNGQWKNWQIFVFTDAASGATFKQTMNARKGEPLLQRDFANMAGQNVWAGATVFYETRGGRELTKYPAQNPRAWWTG